MILDGLVIDRRTRKPAPYYKEATVRLFQGDRFVADIEVRAHEGELLLGTRLVVNLRPGNAKTASEL